MPTGDLKVTVRVDDNGPTAVGWISKDEFTEDNEQNFKWVTATLDEPLPIQATSYRFSRIRYTRFQPLKCILSVGC